MTTATKQIVLVKPAKKPANCDYYDYTVLENGSVVQPPGEVKPGQRYFDGTPITPGERERLNALHREVGPTIELREAGIKVASYLAEIVAGPFAMSDAESDDPNHPAMTRSIVHTPNGQIAWSNLRARYVGPGGEEYSHLSLALSKVLGL